MGLILGNKEHRLYELGFFFFLQAPHCLTLLVWLSLFSYDPVVVVGVVEIIKKDGKFSYNGRNVI